MENVYYEISYVLNDCYDSLLCQRRPMAFSGHIVENIKDVKKFAEELDGKGYITKILEIGPINCGEIELNRIIGE